jgi:hypothetical protein
LFAVNVTAFQQKEERERDSNATAAAAAEEEEYVRHLRLNDMPW